VPHDQPEVDGLLASILDDMSDFVFSSDITVSVGSMLVSGTPIKEEEYFAFIGATIKSAHEMAARTLGAQFEGAAERDNMVAGLINLGEMRESGYQRSGASARRIVHARVSLNPLVDPTLSEETNLPELDADTTDEERELATRTRRFLMLKDVECWAPGGSFSTTFNYWRIPMSAITGWSFGKITRN